MDKNPFKNTERVFNELFKNGRRKHGVFFEPFGPLERHLSLHALHSIIQLQKLQELGKKCLESVNGEPAEKLELHIVETLEKEKRQQTVSLRMRLIHLEIFNDAELDQIEEAFKADCALIQMPVKA